MNRLKQVLHFDYVIYMSPDGTVGNENRATGDWGGVIGELIKKVLLSHSQLLSCSLSKYIHENHVIVMH